MGRRCAGPTLRFREPQNAERILIHGALTVSHINTAFVGTTYFNNLTLKDSLNQFDCSMELAMTGAFVIGRLC